VVTVAGSRINGHTGAEDRVERFLRHSGVISWQPTALASTPLDAVTARILHVAAELEEDTAITVRQGRALGIEREPDIAAFLPVWDLEETEHAVALWALLAEQTYQPPQPAPRALSVRRRMLARVPASAIGRLPQTTFLFCALGAAAEYLAMVTYNEVSKRTDHAPVQILLRDIVRQEARHFAFLLSAAQERGQRLSPVQGRIARRVLRSLWEPIGVPTLGRAVWTELFAPWIAEPEFNRRLRMMDRVVDSIPHLGDMQLMDRFLTGYASPVTPPAGPAANPPR